MLYASFISELSGHVDQTLRQLHNIIQQKDPLPGLMGNLVGEVGTGILGFEAGVLGGEQVDLVLPDLPYTTPYTTAGGLIGGNVGGDVAGAISEPFVSASGLMGPLIPQTSKISVEAIDRKLGVTPAAKAIKSWRGVKDELIHPTLNAIFNPEFLMKRVMASWIPIIPGAINMFARAIEAEDIRSRLDPAKIGKIETLLTDWKAAVEQRAAWAEAAFDAAGSDIIFPGRLLPNVNHMTPKEMLEPIRRSALRQKTQTTLADIARAQRGLAVYKEMGTTDNQYLIRQARTVGPRGHR